MPLTLSEELHISLPDRQDKLDRMLAQYTDNQATIYSRTARDSGDGGGGLMPATWNASYRKLEQLLRLYRAYAARKAQDELAATGFVRTDYWHVAEFYFRCQRTQRPKTKRGKNGKPQAIYIEGKPQFAPDATRRPGIALAIVRSSLEWLDGQWPLWSLPSSVVPLTEQRVQRFGQLEAASGTVPEPFLPTEKKAA